MVTTKTEIQHLREQVASQTALIGQLMQQTSRRHPWDDFMLGGHAQVALRQMYIDQSTITLQVLQNTGNVVKPFDSLQEATKSADAWMETAKHPDGSFVVERYLNLDSAQASEGMYMERKAQAGQAQYTNQTGMSPVQYGQPPQQMGQPQGQYQPNQSGFAPTGDGRFVHAQTGQVVDPNQPPHAMESTYDMAGVFSGFRPKAGLGASIMGGFGQGMAALSMSTQMAGQMAGQASQMNNQVRSMPGQVQGSWQQGQQQPGQMQGQPMQQQPGMMQQPGYGQPGYGQQPMQNQGYQFQQPQGGV